MRPAPHRQRGRPVEETAVDELVLLVGAAPLERHLLIEYLHRIQDYHGHLPVRLLVALAGRMRLSPAQVYEVASFYHHFDIVEDNNAKPAPLTIRVCDSVGCALAGAEELIAALGEALDPADCRVQRVSCIGRCEHPPAVAVGRHVIGCASPARIASAVDGRGTEPEPPDPIGYDVYRRSGGYRLAANLFRSGDEGIERVIDSVSRAGIRGLGGAGFPAARKWQVVRSHPGPRLMAVNIDEGEPGTFKDRYCLERDPHRFLEGMLIAAGVVDAKTIYIYLRDEYADCRLMLQRELAALRRNPPCPLPRIELRRGAGAYICGEESAMIESIEGRRGLPRLRPPYVAERGLFGRPTLVHNLETLYWLRDVLDMRPDAVATTAHRGSRGSRSFSLSGRVNRPGVYVAPAGITARELIEDFGGGMPEGHQLKAYFPGGASGGILPARLADVPLDFDTLAEYGCFVGSAAVIVLSQHDSVRGAALNAMRFFARESCGQCTPCRAGTARAVRLMEQEIWDHAALEDLSQVMVDASICGLGQAAPNPLLCLLRYFPEECS